MSTRERWIVYPLLFMTLGIALRDKVIPPAHLGNPAIQLLCDRLEARQLVCSTLQVNGPGGRPVVVAGADANSHAGIVETLSSTGMPQVRLLSTDTGGIVNTIGRGGRVALVMGDTGQSLGLFAKLPELASLIPLTLPWRFEVKPGAVHAPKEQKPAEPPDVQQNKPKASNTSE